MTEYIVSYSEYKLSNGSGKVILPTNFKEEIVRCRDCVGLVETWNGWECERFSGQYHMAYLNGFCSWAERKGDA